VLLAAALPVFSACATRESRGNEFKMATDSYSIRVSVDPAPPRALEQVAWTVHVTDRETGQPIDAGEGRIFASSRDGKNIANGFAKLEEVGAYRTTLFFITAGTWAMGIQFRRDSAAVLERTQDWTQDVRTGDEPGDFTLPSSRIPTARQDSAADSLPPN
jgi:hypothetical protein